MNPDEKLTKEFLQSLVDIAVKEDRSVSFTCLKNNDETRKAISKINERGCVFLKPTLDSCTVSICPQSVVDFIFESPPNGISYGKLISYGFSKIR